MTRRNLHPSITIVDAGDAVAMTQITATTAGGGVTLNRVDFDPDYFQGDDLPANSFVAWRVAHQQQYPGPKPTGIYGGAVVTQTAIVDQNGDPVLDGDGYPTYSQTITTPGISFDYTFLSDLNAFNISAEFPLDPPWGARGVTGVLSAQMATLVDASITLGVVRRNGVQWMNRTNVDNTPSIVPVHLFSWSRCVNYRTYLAGTDGSSNPTHIQLTNAIVRAGTRLITFDSASFALEAGMYVSTLQSVTSGFLPQIAAVVDSQTVIMSDAGQSIAQNYAYRGTTLLSLLKLLPDGITVTCDSTALLSINDEISWSIGGYVAGQVAEILSGTRFRLAEPAIVYQGDMWAHGGALTADGTGLSDEDVNIGGDHYYTTDISHPHDGWTISTS